MNEEKDLGSRVAPSVVALNGLDLPRSPQPDGSQHMPLPWGTAGVANPATNPRMSVWGPRQPDAQSGEWIAKDVKPENVRFILRACNAHYDLLSALRRLRDLPVDCSQETDREAWAFAHAVIAKAEGR